MGEGHKNQHWIPKAYSRAWCDPAKPGYIHRYNRDGEYVDWRPISYVFSEPDLYTIFGEDGARDIKVERQFLSKRESAFGRIRPKLEKGIGLTEHEHAELLIFVACLHRRTPESRDHWQSFMERVLKAGESMERHLKSLPADQRARAAKVLNPLKCSGDDRSVSLEEWRKQTEAQFGEWLPHHIFIEAREMARMGMIVIHAGEYGQFITSDHPISWWDSQNPPGHRLGLRHAFIEVTLPISPSTCLLFHHGKSGVLNASVAGVAEINNRTLHHCREFFFANSSNLTVDWYPLR